MKHKPTNIQIIGANVSALRRAAHLSQDTLAKRAGISHATLSAIENAGADCNPRLSTMENIARVLGAELTDLFAKADAQ